MTLIDLSSPAVASLTEAVAAKRVVPFVGSGVSRVANLPSWEQLVDGLADELGFDPQVFKALGTFPQLFDYFLSQGKPLNRLANELSTSFTNATVSFMPGPTHRAIAKLGAPTIYTTNYDVLLERTYDALNLKTHVVIDFGDLNTPVENGKTVIVKYHGDFGVPESLVMSETQYFKRMALDSAIDIRLRSDILGRSLLFMGYSLQDMNVRYLLFKLSAEAQAHAAQLGTSAPSSTPAFLVASGVGEVQRTTLKTRFNVECIDLPPGQEAAGLEELLEHCAAAA